MEGAAAAAAALEVPAFVLVKSMTVPTSVEDQQHQVQRQLAQQLDEADPTTYITHLCKSPPMPVTTAGAQQPDTVELIASADSTNGICLFARHTLEFGGRISGHHEGTISRIAFATHSPSVLWSSSYDGSIRCWDLRTQALAHSFHAGNPVESFDIGGTDNMVLAAGVKENILFWDLRKASPGKSQQAILTFSESHNEEITHIMFHPYAQNRLFSSSTDGLVCMFDTTTSDEDEALLSVTPTDKPVEALGFFGKNGAFLYVVSSDQTMALYNIEQNDELGKLEDVRQALAGVTPIDYVVDCQYDPASDSLFMVTGTFATQSGNVDILRVETSGIKPVYRLHGAHSAMVRCFDWDVQSGSMVTGGEDSRLCLWRLQ